MAKKKEQKDMAQEQELRLKFQQKLIEILELGKKKKNMLEYQEIADFFKDLNLDPEKFEMVIDYLEQNGIDVLKISNDDDVVHSLDELHKELEKYNSEDIYIIGGQKIYEQLVDECDVAHITKVDFEYDADAYFPNLDEKPEWQITGDSEEQTYFDLEFYFLRYEKVK